MFVCHSHHHKITKGFTVPHRTWKMTNLKKNALYDSQAFVEHKRTHTANIEPREKTNAIEQWLVTLSSQGHIPYVRFESNEWYKHVCAVVHASHNHPRGIDDFLKVYKSYCLRKKVANNTDESSQKVQEVSIFSGIFNSSGNYKLNNSFHFLSI